MKRATAASRLVRPSAALSALLLGACQPVASEAPPNSASGGVGQGGFSSGVAGTVGVGGGPAPGGAPATGGGPIITSGGVAVACPEGAPIFSPYVIANGQPARKVLYSWTTPEQVVELRRDRQLLIRSEQAGMGRGYAFDVIAKLALDRPDTEVGELAQRLSTDLFPKIRYAWPHPWATRMGWPGEDYGNQLVRIVLKDSAWTALVMSGGIFVVDLQGMFVPLATALQTPERIAAIFFVKDGSSGGTGCGGGTFGGAAGGVIYREFILGNEAMIEEWSLGTDEILQQLGSDIVALSTFLERIRGCNFLSEPLLLATACNWRQTATAADGELANYLGALALPSEYYEPDSTRIAKIVDTLESDLFDPDPLLVVPGQ